MRYNVYKDFHRYIMFYINDLLISYVLYIYSHFVNILFRKLPGNGWTQSICLVMCSWALFEPILRFGDTKVNRFHLDFTCFDHPAMICEICFFLQQYLEKL